MRQTDGENDLAAPDGMSGLAAEGIRMLREVDRALVVRHPTLSHGKSPS
jgi:hypothetical protein